MAQKFSWEWKERRGKKTKQKRAGLLSATTFHEQLFFGVLLIKGMMQFPVLSQYFLFTYKVKVITLF